MMLHLVSKAPHVPRYLRRRDEAACETHQDDGRQEIRRQPESAGIQKERKLDTLQDVRTFAKAMSSSSSPPLALIFHEPREAAILTDAQLHPPHARVAFFRSASTRQSA
jgi:hypothetical protein